MLRASRLQRFAISDTRLALPDFHIEIRRDALQTHVQMQFSHTGQQPLPCIFRRRTPKRLVFTTKQIQHFIQFVFIFREFWFDDHGNDGFGERNFLKRNEMFRITKRIANTTVLQTGHADDVTRPRLFNSFRGFSIDFE